MKIEFTTSRDLDALSRTVKPGDVLESSPDIPEEVLQAYGGNGIARDISAPVNPVTKVSQNTEGGD